MKLSEKKLDHAASDNRIRLRDLNPILKSYWCVIPLHFLSGIDLVRDHPEESLLREVDMIKDCQARMKNLLDRVNLQVVLYLHHAS